MEAVKRIQDNKIIYDITGRVDTQTAPDLQDILDEILNETENQKQIINLVLNLSSVDYLSSAGLRTILHVKKRIDSIEGSSLVIANVQDVVMEIFDMTGFTDFLTFEKFEN